MRALLTVVTPARDERSNLPVLQSSLSDQGLKAIDWLVVDDASRDGTAEWLSSLAQERWPTPRSLRSAGVGAGAARNCAVAEVDTPWVTFVDADDTLDTHALSAWLSAARSLDTDVLLTPTPRHLGFRRRARLGGRHRVLTHAERWSGALLRDWLTPGKVYRTGYLRERSLEFPRIPEAEDLVFFTRAILEASSVGVVPGVPTYRYRAANRSGASRPIALPEETQDAYLDALKRIRAHAPPTVDWRATASPILAGLASTHMRGVASAASPGRDRLRTQLVTGLADVGLRPRDLPAMDLVWDGAHILMGLACVAAPTEAARPIAQAWVEGLKGRQRRRAT